MPPTRGRIRWLMVIAAELVACSSGGGGGGAGGTSGSCLAAYDCPTGQTCASLNGTAFSCRTAGSGVAGQNCDATVGSAITCGEHLLCLATGTPTAGTCVAWCDAAHPCSAGKACQTLTTTMGVTLPLCVGCDVVYNCPRGQTCWTTNGTTFVCMPAGGDLRGDGCDATAGAPVTCGEQLACLSMGTPTAGSCVAWCDSTHPCPAGTSCQTVATTQGATLHFCL